MYNLFVRTHFFGLVAQVTAAAPLPVASIILARSAGLETAGYLAFAQGIVALVFTLSTFGLRSVLAIDGVVRGDFSLYWRVRVWTTALMAAVCSLIAWFWFEPAWILVGVMLLRVGDSFLDLSLGFRQATQEAAFALTGYAGEVAARLLVFIILFAVGILIWRTPLPAFGGASAGASLYVTLLEYRRLRMHRPAATPGRWTARRLLIRAFPFALASVSCSAIMSLPRLLAQRYFSDAQFGAAGIALIIVTFFGMAFYTSWIRANVELRKNGFQRQFLMRYVFEVGFLLAIFAGALYGLLPIIGLVYKINNVELLEMIFKIAVSGLLLNACIGVQNFFKASRRPAAESVVYCTAAGVFILGYQIDIDFLALFHMASAALLLFGGVLAMLIVKTGVRRA